MIEAGGGRSARVHELLASRSIDLILDGQASTGAYLAAPNYPTYRFGWLRDGSFIAYAMDRVGGQVSAHRFHLWVAETVISYAHKVKRLEDIEIAPLRPLTNELALHTRYTENGSEVPEDWGSFQLDGYGFWLSSVSNHVASHGCHDGLFEEAVAVVTRYLSLTWELPCYDSWEEYPQRRHSTTWASVAGGLRSLGSSFDDADAAATAEVITRRLQEAARDGVLRKFADEEPEGGPHAARSEPEAVAGHEREGKPLSLHTVDASILLALGDFGPFDDDDPVVRATVEEVASQLMVGGGVHRYRGDEFYGGGQWPVLSGAYAALSASNPDGRKRALAWIEESADETGDIPEQVSSVLDSPEYLRPWLDRWGPPARPLLWSHAMYLIADHALKE